MVGILISMSIQHILFENVICSAHNSVHIFSVLTNEIREFDKEYEDVLLVHERQLASIEFSYLTAVKYFWELNKL